MEYSVFGKSGVKVSRVAFGGIPIMRRTKKDAEAIVRGVIDMGINFLDTAHGYGDSEEKIGAAIKDYPRDKLIIASKSPAEDKKGFLDQLDESLRRLGTDYVDFYQHHNISKVEGMKKVMGPGGAHEGMEEAVKAGKVRFPAFSSHSIDTAIEVLKTGKFYATQIPFNFVDLGPEKELIPMAEKLGVGFIAMKPLGGGLLENARLCFRFLNQYDSLIPDPGIERLEEMEEIIRYIDDRGPLTEEERREMDRIREEMGSEYCHRCLYCEPCPQGINMSMVLIAKSFAKRLPYEKVLKSIGPIMEKAADCTECRECVERCPYDLPIPDLIKSQREAWEKYKETKVWPA